MFHIDHRLQTLSQSAMPPSRCQSNKDVASGARVCDKQVNPSGMYCKGCRARMMANGTWTEAHAKRQSELFAVVSEKKRAKQASLSAEEKEARRAHEMVRAREYRLRNRDAVNATQRQRRQNMKLDPVKYEAHRQRNMERSRKHRLKLTERETERKRARGAADDDDDDDDEKSTEVQTAMPGDNVIVISDDDEGAVKVRTIQAAAMSKASSLFLLMMNYYKERKVMFDNSNSSQSDVKDRRLAPFLLLPHSINQRIFKDLNKRKCTCNMHIFQFQSSVRRFKFTSQPRMSLLEDFAKAIEQGDSNQIESLLTIGSIDVNARLPREFNPPPLVFAVKCKACRVDVVELLLSTGAFIDGVDDNGQTACHAAVETRNVDLLALLLAHRPNRDIKNSDNKSPLQISLNGTHSQSRYRISVMLINAGASLDGVPDSAVAIPLASLSTVVIRALVNRGVDLNQLRGPLNWTLDAVACNCFESLTSADCRSESHCENACQ
jgi:hypothetical protein